ncbi:uncharacterized protein I206_104875 [Kwoniella pini CBS 10737]|uniref:Helicase C-terminal domain-containing protein n=1 Tax=Kwoniella pini CBS 10737 TaxID=1296096 RepID=A0A1B9I814_9TREE|nr:uncharacterized protein I206_02415 [Kwoniella pini CBS 10737]OCF51700.1 hypothetical protein I206_02415 [Kwoniella pini CBS 10737]
MAPAKTIRNILMELRKVCQHPYISQPELESFEISEKEQHQQLIEASGKLKFLKLLLPKLKERGHRVLLFSQFKIALDRIEDFLYGENVNFLRLDGDVQQAQRQKSMDLFNAPNSEYDVFLLTTRAGGVGINLATADTVIIYDPDFNPHQDLQAIARSHRYGQKKKVLVFKLMIKGSVEENIINKGKKKMVLDHLVVQQMGKESEEGDVDDLLLRGAEAVYSNDGVINAPDIVFNSKNVDELIDKVEADAEQEAKEMEERRKAIEEGKVDNATSKASQQFGFAKIWQADQNQLLNIAEENEEDDDAGRRSSNWESILEAMEKERQDKLNQMLSISQPKRIRNSINQPIVLDKDIMESDGDGDTPEKRKKKRKKSKASSVSGSDYEFDAKHLPQDEDSDEISDSGIPDELLREQKKLRRTHSQQQLAADIPSVPGPSTHPLPQSVSGPSNHLLYAEQPHHVPHTIQQESINPLDQALPKPINHVSATVSTQGEAPRKRGRPSLHKEEKQARKRRRFEEKAALANAQVQALTHSSGHNFPNGTSTIRSPNNLPPPSTDQADFGEARQILNLLYSVLKEFGNDKNIRRWGFIALPELPPEERTDRYRILAADTDNHLTQLGQPKYFSLPEQLRIVSGLFQARGDVITSGQLGVPLIPHDVGTLIRPSIIAAPAALNPAPKIKKRIELSQSSVNGHVTPPPNVNAILGPSTMAGLSSRHNSSPHPPGPYTGRGPPHDSSVPGSYITDASSNVPHGVRDDAGPSTFTELTNIHEPPTTTQPLRPADSSETLFNSLMDSAPPTCQFCQQDHSLKDCNELSSVEDLQSIKQAILEGNEPEYGKMIALKNVEKTQQWLIKAGRLTSEGQSKSPFTKSVLTPINSLALSQSTNGTFNTPSKNGQRLNSTKTPNSISKGKNKENSTNENVVNDSIEIIDSPNPNSNSNDNSLNLDKRIISWSTNSTKSTKSRIICSFCEKNCDKQLKTCINLNGGRKSLKMKIRECDNRILSSLNGISKKNLTFMQAELYKVYKEWPRE